MIDFNYKNKQFELLRSIKSYVQVNYRYLMLYIV